MLRFVRKLLSNTYGPAPDPTTIAHADALKWSRHRHVQFNEAVNAVLPYLNNNAAIFDIGANIGYFSLLLMERLHFSGKAYLFEPVPNLARLCEETFHNTAYDVTINQFALSDQDTDLKMLVDMDGNIGWNTLIVEKKTANMKPITIHARRFDSLAIPHRPDFIKIDVEGSEYKVLSGMLTSLSAWRPLPVILCEVGWGKSHPHWQEELEVFNNLAKLGYMTFDINKRPINLLDLTHTSDVLFLPSSA
ncbi:MAG: FkbM family methyltransferase [Nitrospira sp.]|jgi:FkbM family methyltransferase|nr:FkbM family methyltransferase [Nitrospira sp.]